MQCHSPGDTGKISFVREFEGITHDATYFSQWKTAVKNKDIKYNILTPFNINPFMPIVALMQRSADFNLRRDHQKNSYQRRDYESVDEKSLS